MKVFFIRHGKTAGNEMKRYIGRTDECLSDAGIEEIQFNKRSGVYPEADIVIHSGMRRTRETVDLIYGDSVTVLTNEKLRECDFGTFEGKNYKELSGNRDYQRWIDSNGTLPFPEGESIETFRARCVEGFIDCLERFKECGSLVLCVHGGTIMAILSSMAEDAACNQASGQGKTYYDYHCDNGQCLCYEVCFESKIVLKQI